jgi:riboflavin kinase / FMN adenylyltransferase
MLASKFKEIALCMKVFRELRDIPADYMGAYVTIGNFDGVHRGHTPIFQKLIDEAHANNRKAMVITFDPHPKNILHPDIKPFYLITTIEEKIHLIEDQGMDGVVIIPFSLEFSKLTPEEFILQILWDTLRIRKIYIGYDYSFGKNKRGNETLLRAFGKKLGFEVDVIPAVKLGDTVISSTRLRLAILEGDVKTAATLLGRPYNIGGAIIHGKGRGNTLNFPTANIAPEKALIPAQGVYAVLANLEERQYDAVLNIGCNPTFSDEKLSIEVHLFDFDRNIYGERMNILFVDRIRNETKFEGPKELIEQIKRDIDRAKAILNEHQRLTSMDSNLQAGRRDPAGA